MSYVRKMEYTIEPEESFKIICNCSGCGGKTLFHNTNNFRVNANGNKIDIWLIYQCTKCKHTNNLTVYQRCRPDSILKEEYEAFLSNSKKLALFYGTNRQFFTRNKAEVDWSSMTYHLNQKGNEPFEKAPFFQKGDFIVIHNSHVLKVRTEKVLSELLKLSRAKMKELLQLGTLDVSEDSQEHKISVTINGEIFYDKSIENKTSV